MTQAHPTILIVDDDPQLRASLALMMENAGYKGIDAADGQEALLCLQTLYVDLVFLDVRLPDQNGMDLLAKIRKLCPDTPVIILTAHASLETAIDAVRKGARDFLLKPIRPEELIPRVQEILAEQAQPFRRKEIVNRLQSLLDELKQAETEKGLSGKHIPGSTADPDRYLSCGPITLDLHARRVLTNGKMVRIPPTTFDYLVTLVRYAPKPVSYESLVKESQGYPVSRLEAREIAVWHIHELRRALEVDPREPSLIITIRNLGYRLVAG